MFTKQPFYKFSHKAEQVAGQVHGCGKQKKNKYMYRITSYMNNKMKNQ